MTLGTLIQCARKAQNLTAKDLKEKTRLDVSPSLISLWESDRRVPTPEHLHVLCDFLNIDLKTAFMFWAQAHMPTKQLKCLFQPGDRYNPPSDKKEAKEEPTTFPASVTITLQKRDIPWFTKYPEAAIILTRCLMAGLKNTSWPISKITLDLNISKNEALNAIGKLKDLGYVIEENKGYRTPHGIKYIYRPDTPDFEPLRRARMKYVFDRILSNTTGMMDDRKSPAYLKMFGKTLSPSQIRYFCDALEAIFTELIDAEPESSSQSLPCYLVVALGPEHVSSAN